MVGTKAISVSGPTVYLISSYLYLYPIVGIGCNLQNIRIGTKSRVIPAITQQGDSFFQPSVELYDLQIIFFRGYIPMGIFKGAV